MEDKSWLICKCDLLASLLKEARGEISWSPAIKPLLARIDAALSDINGEHNAR
jgi:hypothetical protein